MFGTTPWSADITFIAALKNIINYIMLLTIGIGILVIAFAGLPYYMQKGDQKKRRRAEAVVFKTTMGLMATFIVWLVLAIFLQIVSYINVIV
jgi:hypothetical protein